MRGFHVLTFEKSLQFYGALCGLGGEAVKTNPRLLNAHSPDLYCEFKGILVFLCRSQDLREFQMFLAVNRIGIQNWPYTI